MILFWKKIDCLSVGFMPVGHLAAFNKYLLGANVIMIILVYMHFLHSIQITGNCQCS